MNFVVVSKWSKRVIAFVSDTTATILACLIASWLTSRSNTVNLNVHTVFTLVGVQCCFYLSCGLYRGIWRFASLPDLIRILRAVVFGTMINAIVISYTPFTIPFKTFLIYTLLLMSFLSSLRLIFRWYSDYPKFFAHGKRVLIVGAGSAGASLVGDLYRSSLLNQFVPAVFVDDNPALRGCEVQGVRVVGKCADIPKITAKYDIELIMIAIPSASSKRMREIVQYCEASKVPFRTLPSLKNIAEGIVKISSLREILLEDLLGREQIYHDWAAIKTAIQQKVILVTGGGGSIGSELCRQIAKLLPAKLIIVDNSEFNLYSIDMELIKNHTSIEVCTHLGSVTDKVEMESLFARYQPDLVFHVAAYKHVPLLETQIRVAMYNNIIGTCNIANLADQYKVNKFVLISTDKAVNPTSMMGATKRASEVYCQNFNRYSATQFVTVRFGNVLDSAGSVIPLFRQQIQQGGPVTVTHPDISRFFMTIPEAAQLILQAMIISDEGEIFVLDMGDPINIRYLAEQMIKLSGKVIGHDIEIEYTGLRPGEKLFEELFHKNEVIGNTSHPKIKQAKVRHYDWHRLQEVIHAIEIAYQANNIDALLTLLYQLVPEYHDGNVVPLLKPTEIISLEDRLSSNS